MDDKSLKPVGSESSGFAAADYNYVAMNSRLRLVSLASSSFSVKADCLPDRKSWKLTYDWEIVACKYDQQSNTVSAIFSYEVVAKSGRKTAMRCSAEYAVAYAVPNDSKVEAAEGYCHNVGGFAAYPYFRALVAQFASGANLMLPPLPAIASTAHIPKKNDPKAVK
jgi:hypothetical protein